MMEEQDELSLDFIDELLADPKTKTEEPKRYPPPEFTSTYVKTGSKFDRCIHRGCGAPSYILVKDEPYCTVHTIHVLANLLDEKINHFPGSVPKIEKILEAYLELGERLPAEPDKLNAFNISITREDHKSFTANVDGREYIYSAHTSPEGVLTQSLLDLLGNDE
jgi:hypothetical protein